MAKHNKAYKFRLYPTTEQALYMRKTFGCVRFVYNKMLAERKETYERHRDDKEALKKVKHPTPAKVKGTSKAIQPIEIQAVIGLDFAMDGLFVDSETGKKANYPRFYRQMLERLATNQRKLSRKKAVVIEDLDMKGMSRALKFGKSVADNGWGMFTFFLQYKLKEQGKRLIKIDKWFPSTRKCSSCANKQPERALSGG